MSQVDDLFATLCKEFGKPAKKKKNPFNPPTRLTKEQAAAQAREENARKIEALRNDVTWKPVAIVSYIIVQECTACAARHEFVGGHLVRHQHKTTGSIWEYARPRETIFNMLPHELVERSTNVQRCPDCLRDAVGYSPFTLLDMEDDNLVNGRKEPRESDDQAILDSITIDPSESN